MNEFLVGVLQKEFKGRCMLYQILQKSIAVSTLVDQLRSLVITHLSEGLVAPALLQMDAETNFSGLLQRMEGCHPWKQITLPSQKYRRIVFGRHPRHN